MFQLYSNYTRTYHFTARLLSFTIKPRYFARVCSELKQRSEAPRDCEERMGAITRAKELFMEVGGGRWNQVSNEHVALVNWMKSILKTKSGELDEMSQSAKEHGISEGNRNVQALSLFEACTWFDRFVEPQDKFVANCAIKFKQVYRARIKEVVAELSKHYKFLLDDRHDANASFPVFKRLLPEAHEITKFASVMGEERLSSFERQVRDKLAQYVARFEEYTQQTLKKWGNAVREEDNDEINGMTESLHEALCEMNAMRKLDSECDTKLDSIRSEIHCTFKTFSETVQSVLASNGQYHAMAGQLRVVQELGNFANTSPILPDFHKLQKQVRDHVAADAQKIQDMVSETSEWDVIDRHLVKFEEATVLDKYTSDEATSRLRPLRKLREQKETQVDELLNDLIADQDFAGIHNFLEPLASSTDQVNTQKFERCRTKIYTSLRGTVDNLNRCLSSCVSEENTRRIVEGLGILGHAETEMNEHLNNRNFRLHATIQKLTKKVNDKLERLLKHMADAVRTTDYMKLGANHQLATAYSKETDPYLFKATRKKLNSANTQYKKAIKAVPLYIKTFVDSVFKDSAGLVAALSSLQSASESDSPELPDLATLCKSICSVISYFLAW